MFPDIATGWNNFWTWVGNTITIIWNWGLTNYLPIIAVSSLIGILIIVFCISVIS